MNERCLSYGNPGSVDYVVRKVGSQCTEPNVQCGPIASTKLPSFGGAKLAPFGSEEGEE